MRLTTIQNKHVLDILKNNEIYYADFDKISFSNYKKQWKELAKYLGFNECPIFCSPIDDDTATTASFIKGVKITLNVPDEECHVMDYYGFSDWLYYSSGQEYDDYFDWGADKALKNIDKYLDKTADIVQVIINRIDPKWVDWSLTEATRQQLINKSRNADKTKSYGTTRFDRRNIQHVYNPKDSLNKLDQNALWKANILSFYLSVQGETDNYTVEVLFDGVLDDINKELKRNKYEFEYKVVYRALINAINRQDIFVSCTCLHPNTKIKLLDGTSPTIEEMKNRYDKGEELWVYSVDENGDFKPGLVEDVFITKKESKFIKIILDNDKEILTTEDHQFMLRDGSYLSANKLSIGQSLMPIYFNSINGYETLKLNTENGWYSTYKLVANELYKDEIEQKIMQSNKDKLVGIDKMKYDVAIHHKDFNKLNNNPNNLEVMTGYEHWMYHANTIDRLWKNQEFRQKTSERSKEWMQYLNANPTEKMVKQREDFLEKGHEYWRTNEGRHIKSDLMKKVSRDFWDNISKEDYERIRENYYGESWKLAMSESHKNFWNNLSEEDYIKRCKLNSEVNNRPEVKEKIRRSKIKRVLETIINLGLDLTEESYNKVKSRTDVKWSTYYNTFNDLLIDFGFNNNYNHKIKSIEVINLNNDIDVYDIKVSKWHNFLVDSGVILHNCADFYYTFSYQATKERYNAGKSVVIPAKVRNPNDTKGAGCKHILKVLGNLDWALDLASCITNYVLYMQENYPDKYENIIFPALYGMSYLEATNQGILDTGEEEINIENEDDEISIEDTDDEFADNDDVEFSEDEE